MKADPLEIAACELVARCQRAEDLPALAVDALVRGIDGLALVELAGQDPSDVRNSADLFREALSQLGIVLPGYEEAVSKVMRATAQGIVDGDVSPEVGARRISRWASDVENSGDLRIFVGLASQLEDHPEDRAVLEKEIIDAAGDFLNRARPRMWIKLMAVNGRSPLPRTNSLITSTARFSRYSACSNATEIPP